MYLPTYLTSELSTTQLKLVFMLDFGGVVCALFLLLVKWGKQAGAELCQAQGKLRLVRLTLIDSNMVW